MCPCSIIWFDINQPWGSLVKSVNTYTYFNYIYISERI